MELSSNKVNKSDKYKVSDAVMPFESEPEKIITKRMNITEQPGNIKAKIDNIGEKSGDLGTALYHLLLKPSGIIEIKNDWFNKIIAFLSLAGIIILIFIFAMEYDSKTPMGTISILKTISLTISIVIFVGSARQVVSAARRTRPLNTPVMSTPEKFDNF